MSYFQRKPSGILETDAASFQPILILLPDDTVAIILGLTQLDRAALLTGSPSPLPVKACRLRTALESKEGLSVSEMPPAPLWSGAPDPSECWLAHLPELL